MKQAEYTVVNANGAAIKHFGADFKSAKEFAQTHQGCGLLYGLRVKKYFVNV